MTILKIVDVLMVHVKFHSYFTGTVKQCYLLLPIYRLTEDIVSISWRWSKIERRNESDGWMQCWSLRQLGETFGAYLTVDYIHLLMIMQSWKKKWKWWLNVRLESSRIPFHLYIVTNHDSRLYLATYLFPFLLINLFVCFCFVFQEMGINIVKDFLPKYTRKM